MKFPLKTTIVLAVVAASGAAAYSPLRSYWNNRHRPKYRQAEVTRGTIVAVVNSTGPVTPVKSVLVGAFVSGPIEKLHVDYNDVVTAGQLLAEIDPRLYQANVDRDKALLATRRAELKRAEALLQQAANDLARVKKLRHKDPNLISETEMDQFEFNHKSLEAQRDVAQTSVESAEANLKNSQANLDYTMIRSPVEGTIIARKVNEGQTLAATFQVPELFVVAPDLKSEIRIIAAVDEADIGLVSEAQRRKLPVWFTVDAHKNDLFEGTIFQVRWDSAIEQNVVTYPVVVSAPNPDLKLLPGMTASLSFQVDEAADVLRIPNAALRFYPQREHVRPEDRYLLDGDEGPAPADASASSITRSATDKFESRRVRNRRHVWIADGHQLRAVEVITGISDSRYAQLVSGELSEGQQLVTGSQPAE
jgi:HlyD family secretion protein